MRFLGDWASPWGRSYGGEAAQQQLGIPRYAGTPGLSASAAARMVAVGAPRRGVGALSLADLQKAPPATRALATRALAPDKLGE